MKNTIVKKHNELVKNARYSLSEQSIKLVSMLIAMIKVEDVDFQEYSLQVKDFANAIKSNSKDIYKQVDKLTDELMSKPFKIEDEKFNWCYYAKYIQGEAYLKLKIAPELKPYLLNLKKDFLEYNLNDILSLKSGYVIRFYELLIQSWRGYRHYNSNANSYTFELEIEKLRELFELSNSYKYSHIKERIIDKAKKQFKARTNIQFDYKEQKLGRKVVRLQITVKDNEKGSNDPLSTLKTFIKYLRTDFKNIDLYHVPNKQCLSINSEGKLYDKYQNEVIDNKRSQELYEKLYQLALDDKLPSIKQAKFDF